VNILSSVKADLKRSDS